LPHWVALQANIDIAETVGPTETLVGARLQLRPASATLVRETVPDEPPREATVIVTPPLVLASNWLIVVWLVMTEKSNTITWTLTRCTREPLVPVTLTL